MTATSAGRSPNSSATTWLTTVSGLLPHSGQPSSTRTWPNALTSIFTLSGVDVGGQRRLVVEEPPLGRVVARALLAARQADADVAALRARLLLLGAPAVDVGERERRSSTRLVVAAVVRVAGRDLVRELLGPDEVPPPDLGALEPELVRGGVDEPLEDEVAGVGARPAEEALLDLVRQHALDPVAQAADPVRAGRLRQRVAVLAVGELEVGAVVVDDVELQREELAVAGRPRARRRRAGPGRRCRSPRGCRRGPP